MKKLLQKKTLLLLCALLLFSLGCMGVLAVADPKDSGSTAETEMMTDGAIPLAAELDETDVATPSEPALPEIETRTVTLNANGGELTGAAKIQVNEETGEILSDLPTPTREGWTFKGWYTEQIKEVYLSGGDEEADGASYTLVSEKEVITKLREQVKDTKWANLSDADLLQKHHSWLIDDTAGKLVTKGQNLEGTVSTLYAKYEPKTVHVNWNNNGWQGSAGALRSSGQYGGYVYTWDQTGDQWGDRVFAGWSFTRDGEVAIENGCVYKLGGKYLDFTDTDTINLYAVWTGGEGRDVKEVKVSIYTDSTHRALHLQEGWRYFIEYKLLPEEAFDDPVEWSIDPPGAGHFEEQGTKNRMLVVIYKRTDITSATVTVTAANGVKGSVEIPLKHSWNRNYTYQPNCQHDGYAVDVCSVCGLRNQPKFPKTDHTYTRLAVPATCTEPGYTDNICKVCGHEEKTITGPALGHTWGEITTVQSCGGAVETKTCTVCGFTQTDVDVNDAAHQWESVMTVDKAPTCSEAGSRSYHCAVCGLTKDSETIPANPDLHRWTGWSLKTAAQVGSMGADYRRCWTCGVVETRDTEALLPEAESLAAGSTSAAVAAAPDLRALQRLARLRFRSFPQRRSVKRFRSTWKSVPGIRPRTAAGCAPTATVSLIRTVGPRSTIRIPIPRRRTRTTGSGSTRRAI